MPDNKITLAPRRYPVGMQSFPEVRAGGFAYVDKTGYIYDLAHGSGKAFFLSRPRRFGKTLLVSTMQAYFEGRRELFEGLALADLEPEWESFPVLRLDLSAVKTRGVDELRSLLDSALRDLEAVWGRDPADATPGSRLKSLIKRARARTGKQAVALIDEYDAPLLNVADDPVLLEQFRLIMRELYAPLKSCDADLRFVFLTGITKFSQLSIFSELNNLKNVSMDPRYAAACGISEEELLTQLSGDVDAFAARLGASRGEALAALKRQYDGYHFCAGSPDIYNPFSLLNALDDGALGSYWFASGTPTFLVDLMRREGWDLTDLDGCEAMESEFDAPTERMDSPLPLLYQAGYLTIKSYDPDGHAYTLGVPNREVRHGLSESLLRYARDPGTLRAHNAFLLSFARALRAGDMEAALSKMRSYLKGIPYDLAANDEKGFQVKFYLIFDLLGIQVETEFRTSDGRADAVVWTRDAVYVMEFKYDKTPEEALAQIDAKGYAVPFEGRSDGRRLYKVGVNYSSSEQTVDRWVIREA